MDSYNFPPQRKLRSCVPCAASKRSCDHNQPCGRCISLGLQGQCIIAEDRRRKQAKALAASASVTITTQRLEPSASATLLPKKRPAKSPADAGDESEEIPLPDAADILQRMEQAASAGSELIAAMPTYADAGLLGNVRRVSKLFEQHDAELIPAPESASAHFHDAHTTGAAIESAGFSPHEAASSSSSSLSSSPSASFRSPSGSPFPWPILESDPVADAISDVAYRSALSLTPLAINRVLFFDPTIDDLRSGAPLRVREVIVNAPYIRLVDACEPADIARLLNTAFGVHAQPNALHQLQQHLGQQAGSFLGASADPGAGYDSAPFSTAALSASSSAAVSSRQHQPPLTHHTASNGLVRDGSRGSDTGTAFSSSSCSPPSSVCPSPHPSLADVSSLHCCAPADGDGARHYNSSHNNGSYSSGPPDYDGGRSDGGVSSGVKHSRSSSVSGSGATRAASHHPLLTSGSAVVMAAAAASVSGGATRPLFDLQSSAAFNAQGGAAFNAQGGAAFNAHGSAAFSADDSAAVAQGASGQARVGHGPQAAFTEQAGSMQRGHGNGNGHGHAEGIVGSGLAPFTAQPQHSGTAALASAAASASSSSTYCPSAAAGGIAAVTAAAAGSGASGIPQISSSGISSSSSSPASYYARFIHNSVDNTLRMTFRPDTPADLYPWNRRSRVHPDDRLLLYRTAAKAILLRLPSFRCLFRFQVSTAANGPAESMAFALLENCVTFEYSPIGCVRAMSSCFAPVRATGKSDFAALTAMEGLPGLGDDTNKLLTSSDLVQLSNAELSATMILAQLQEQAEAQALQGQVEGTPVPGGGSSGSGIDGRGLQLGGGGEGAGGTGSAAPSRSSSTASLDTAVSMQAASSLAAAACAAAAVMGGSHRAGRWGAELAAGGGGSSSGNSSASAARSVTHTTHNATAAGTTSAGTWGVGMPGIAAGGGAGLGHGVYYNGNGIGSASAPASLVTGAGTSVAAMSGSTLPYYYNHSSSSSSSTPVEEGSSSTAAEIGATPGLAAVLSSYTGTAAGAEGTLGIGGGGSLVPTALLAMPPWPVHQGRGGALR